MIRQIAIAAVGLSVLAACATAPIYRPADSARSTGYMEQKIEEGRYSVSFRGSSSTPREDVEAYLLYRAAELTLNHGFDHFIVVTRGVDSKSQLRPSHLSVSAHYGFGYSYYHPRYGWRGMYDPFWHDAPTYREVTRYEATAEIVMREGEKPADDEKAFDARDVMKNVGQRIMPASN